MVELLDVDVVSREDLDASDEPCRTEHVPHPGVVERYLQPPVAPTLELDPVREVEAAIRLHHVREHRQHVAVLAVQLELPFVFEPFDVVVAHASSGTPIGIVSPAAISGGASASSSRSAAIAASTLSHLRPTPLKDIRWIGVGPRRSSVSQWWRVPYPLFDRNSKS